MARLLRKNGANVVWATRGGGFRKTQTPHRLRLQLATHSGVSTSLPIGANILRTQTNQLIAPGMAFLDSENPNHYGPRGFKQGRQHLDLLVTPQCPRRGF
jgi:hypothetical protein